MKTFGKALKRIGIILLSLLAIIGALSLYFGFQEIQNINFVGNYPSFIKEIVLAKNKKLIKTLNINQDNISNIEFLETENPNSESFKENRFYKTGLKEIPITPETVIEIPAEPNKERNEFSGYALIVKNDDIFLNYIPRLTLGIKPEQKTESKAIELRFKNAISTPRTILHSNPEFSREKGPYPKINQYIFGANKTGLHAPRLEGDFCFFLHDSNILTPERNTILPDCIKIYISNVGGYPETILESEIRSFDGINPATIEAIYHTIKHTPQGSEIIESK